MLKERFIEYLNFEKRYSLHTVLSYENDLNQFATYLRINYAEDDISKADSVMIRSWVVSLLEQGISSRSINRKLSTLKSFFHFCRSTGNTGSNPMLKVISLKNKHHLPVYIEKDRMDRLFESVKFDSGFEGIRDRMMLMLLYATGIRRSELIHLTIEDIDFGKSTLKVLGKRSKERILPLGDYICDQLLLYIKEREGIEKSSVPYPGEYATAGAKNVKSRSEKNNHGLLFVTIAGTKMDSRQVYSIVHRYLSMITSQSYLGPHVLRHTFATHMLNEGADLNSIKELLGHTSLAATQVYTHNTIEKLKLIYKQAHPRA